MATAAEQSRQAGPSRWLAIALLVCGVALGAPTAYKIASTFIDTVISPPKVHVPGQTTVHLKAGKYVIFQRTGTTAGGAGFSFTTDRGVSIDPSMVSVSSAAGTAIAVGIPGGTETITQGSRRYTGAVEFRVPSEGDYRILVDAPSQSDALVSRSIGETLRSLLPWIGVGVVAFLLFAAGVTLLIVGEVRRNRQHRLPPPPPWSPPAPA